LHSNADLKATLRLLGSANIRAMRVKLLIPAAVVAVTAVSVAIFVLITGGGEESGEGDETVTDFAPVRAYTGFHIDTQDWPGLGPTAFVDRVGAGSPAQLVGLQQADVVRQVGGAQVTNAKEVYAEIEKKSPGDSLDIEVHRYDQRLLAPNRPLPEPEKLTLTLELVEEPRPGASIVWVPYTAMDEQDQLRMGVILSEVTRPLAQHYGIAEPSGVLVRSALPRIDSEQWLQEGDVIMSFDGRKVVSLSRLQEAVRNAPEDKSITIGVRRGSQDLKFTLDALGPSVPGANALPAQARERLHDAIKNGGLHPDHLQIIASSHRRTDPTPGQSFHGAGTIKKLSDSSITIQLFGTGSEWKLAIDSSTIVAGIGARGLSDLNVGEFVELFSSGDTANRIYSKAAPLRQP
jgi:hypothetical protein